MELFISCCIVSRSVVLVAVLPSSAIGIELLLTAKCFIDTGAGGVAKTGAVNALAVLRKCGADAGVDCGRNFAAVFGRTRSCTS